MYERAAEILKMAEKLLDECKDIMLDWRMMSEEDYELMVAEDEELHTELSKIEDLENAIEEILG